MNFPLIYALSAVDELFADLCCAFDDLFIDICYPLDELFIDKCACCITIFNELFVSLCICLMEVLVGVLFFFYELFIVVHLMDCSIACFICLIHCSLILFHSFRARGRHWERTMSPWRQPGQTSFVLLNTRSQKWNLKNGFLASSHLYFFFFSSLLPPPPPFFFFNPASIPHQLWLSRTVHF